MHSRVVALRRRPRTATAVIAFAFFTDFCLLLMLVPILPLMRESMGVTEEQIGILFALKSFAQLLSNGPMGWCVDKFGARAPMVGGLLAMSAATVLFAVSDSYYLLCFARLMQGVASSANVVGGMAHLSKVFPSTADDRPAPPSPADDAGGRADGRDDEVADAAAGAAGTSIDDTVPLASSSRRGSGDDVLSSNTDDAGDGDRGAEMSKALTGISIGVMAGAPLGGVLFEVGGRQLPFIVLAVILALDAVARLTLLPEPAEVQRHRDAARARAASRRSRGATAAAALRAGDDRADGDDDGADSADAATFDMAVSQGRAGAEDDGARRAGDRARDDDGGADPTTNPDPDLGARSVATPDEAALPAMQAYLALVRDWQVMTVAIVKCTGNGAIAFIEAMFPLFLHEQLGQSRLAIGFIYGAQTALYTICVPYLGKYGGGWGRHRLMFAGMVNMGISVALIPLVPHLGWVLPAWMSISTGMSSIDSSTPPVLADIVEARHRGSYGKAFALSNTASSLGFVLGPILGGFLTESDGFATASIVVGCVLLACSPVVVHAFRASKPPFALPRVCGPAGSKGGHVELVDVDNVEDVRL